MQNKSRTSGEVLPFIPELEELYASGVKFRRGMLAMIAGRPGSQKSGFALWLCAQWGLPTLYFAADMGEHVATTRDGSICTGLTSEEVSDILKDRDRKPALVQKVKEDSVFKFVYDANPSLQDVDDEIDAWVEMQDNYPPVIVLDNLMDIQPINESEYASNKALLLELKAMARTTGAFLLILHHNREESNPALPAPAKALQGKVSQTPELVLSVALDDTHPEFKVFRLAAVKNRTGPASPTGERYIELIPDPSRTSFTAKSIYSQAAAANAWLT